MTSSSSSLMEETTKKVPLSSEIKRTRPALQYQSGFGNHFSTEAIPNALPEGQNTPQTCPYGLYAEQLSGTAFTVPREHNQRSWLYRIRPSVVQSRFIPVASSLSRLGLLNKPEVTTPAMLRWRPLPLPMPASDPNAPTTAGSGVDFVHGLVCMMGAGDPDSKQGLNVFMYAADTSMVDVAFQNSDGDFLVVPQMGTLHIRTEMGILEVEPREIVVLPRGIKFQIDVDAPSRGYVLEVFEGHFQLPQLGPLGANGLANPRDFKYPVAAFQDLERPFRLFNKFGGELFEATLPASPFNVVAWHGNYAPFKYNLDDFCCVGSVTYDHLDPSIFTVLTCPSAVPGVAVADFVVFPPRWMVMEHTFRPPYYHRNVMSEYMGMVYGKYDAKEGFLPGGASLHSCMSPHGPDLATFEKATTEALAPVKFEGGLAFMFETCYVLKLTDWAVNAPHLEEDYEERCWARLPKKFVAPQEDGSQK